MRSRWIANGLLVAGSLLAALLVAEALVRGFFRDQTPLFPRYHTDYQYGRYTLRGLRPNAEFWHTSVEGSWRFVTNGRGFRNERDFPYAKPAGVVRVLSIGDSQTQGYEVGQNATYSAVLERYLNARGMRAEVLNAGVSGFGNAEALAFLENEGHRYQPDVVVLGFFGNDFADNIAAPLFALDERGSLVEKSYAHVPGVRVQNLIYRIPGIKWLGENSYFYNLLFNRVWLFFKERLHKSILEFAVPNSIEHNEREIALASALIKRMHDFCATRGMRFIVLDIPERTAPYRFRSSMPGRMRAALGAAGVELVDAERLLGRFDGAAEIHRAQGNLHITELTHAVFGVELAERIVGGGLRDAPWSLLPVEARRQSR